MRRTALKSRSAKRVAADEAYAPIRKAIIARDQRCMAPIAWGRCEGVWDVHHIVSRARDRTLAHEHSNLTTLCRKHHDYAHLHPLEAAERGLLKSA